MTPSHRTVPACLAAALALSLTGASAAVAGPPGRTDAGAGVTPRPSAAPVEAPVSTAPPAGTPLEGQYVVVFRPGTRGAGDLARTLTRESGGQLLHTYEHALQGFAARLPEGRAAALRRNPDVALVEQDAVATVADTQTGATWGLDRSDQRTRPLDGSWTDGNEGVGVHVYVVDTGVLGTHTEFAGRMGNGYDAVTAGGSATDCNGHGTHVAGTAAGHDVRHRRQGRRAPGAGARLRRLGQQLRRHRRCRLGAGQPRRAGRGQHEPRRRGVLRPRHRGRNAIGAGITFAVAAGNENTNACNGSPSRVARP
jgi:subtilisin family serine protease